MEEFHKYDIEGILCSMSTSTCMLGGDVELVMTCASFDSLYTVVTFRGQACSVCGQKGDTLKCASSYELMKLN